MRTRAQALGLVQEKQFDLVVIGGGIAGAGVAQDAALRGLSVALVEKDDFASGTSSRTTKLIHGGLRYLEQCQFKLTRELCQERALLSRLAPHLVRDFSFVMPLIKGDMLFSLKADFGLTLYDLMSWSVSGAHHHQRLAQKEVLEAAPALAQEVVTGGLRFHDCITDDSRMVIEVIKSACHYGAIAINYLEVLGFDTEGGKINSVRCHDRYSGADITLSCRQCVNATGVWSDQVLRLLDSSWQGHVVPSKGTHIVVRQSAFETNTALFLRTLDKRYVFVVPWQRALMIGTTDRLYAGEIDRPLPDKEEIDYLLLAINGYTKSHQLCRSDIIGSFSGLRPLVGSVHGASSTSGISREHIIFDGPGGSINLSGGKLTNYRLMAGEVVDRLVLQMPDYNGRCSRTKEVMLGGFKDSQHYLSSTAAIAVKSRKLGIEPASLDHLISSYGADAEIILDIVEKDASLNERICPDFPPIMAEVPFCAVYEMAISLSDLLLRRLRLGVLHQRQCLAAAPKVCQLLMVLLKWDDARAKAELLSFEREMAIQWDN